MTANYINIGPDYKDICGELHQTEVEIRGFTDIVKTSKTFQVITVDLLTFM